MGGAGRGARVVPVGPQRGLIVAVLRAPLAFRGPGRDRAALDRHPVDDPGLLPHLAGRRVADGALSALGIVRVGSQLHGLAAEWLRGIYINSRRCIYSKGGAEGFEESRVYNLSL